MIKILLSACLFAFTWAGSAFSNDFTLYPANEILDIRSNAVQSVEIVESGTLSGRYYMKLEWTPAQRQAFEKMTGANIGGRLGIIDRHHVITSSDITDVIISPSLLIGLPMGSHMDHPMLGEKGIVTFFTHDEARTVRLPHDQIHQKQGEIFIPWSGPIPDPICSAKHLILFEDEKLASKKGQCQNDGLSFEVSLSD